MSTSELMLAMFIEATKPDAKKNHEACNALRERSHLINLDSTCGGDIGGGGIVEQRYDAGICFFDSPYIREITQLPDFNP